MPSVFVVGVAGGLELERGVLNVEMPDQAVLQLVEQLRDVSVEEAVVVYDDVGRQDRHAGGDGRGVQIIPSSTEDCCLTPRRNSRTAATLLLDWMDPTVPLVVGADRRRTLSPADG